MAFVADTHVHLYPQFDLGRTFAGAGERLSSAAKEKFPELPDIAKFLCLSERPTESFFSWIASGKSQPAVAAAPTSEPESLRIELPAGGPIYLVAGKQFVTTERLEVLFLGCIETPPPGLSLKAAVSWAASQGVLAVLPWSFGKWFGARGKKVQELVDTGSSGPFVLGDITMRPGAWPRPAAMKLAGKKGIAVISGSDPLPLAGEEELIGRNYIWGKGEINPEAPWRSLHEIIFRSPQTVRIGGEQGSTLSLIRRSLRYRLRKPASTSTVPSNTN